MKIRFRRPVAIALAATLLSVAFLFVIEYKNSQVVTYQQFVSRAHKIINIGLKPTFGRLSTSKPNDPTFPASSSNPWSKASMVEVPDESIWMFDPKKVTVYIPGSRTMTKIDFLYSRNMKSKQFLNADTEDSYLRDSAYLYVRPPAISSDTFTTDGMAIQVTAYPTDSNTNPASIRSELVARKNQIVKHIQAFIVQERY